MAVLLLIPWSNICLLPLRSLERLFRSQSSPVIWQGMAAKRPRGSISDALGMPSDDCWNVETGVMGAYGPRGSRIMNSLYLPTSLWTVIVPACCRVTIS
jgi:hypothetical protein